MQMQQQAIALRRNNQCVIVLAGQPRDEGRDRLALRGPTISERGSDGFKARTREAHVHPVEFAQVAHQRVAHHAAFDDERAHIDETHRVSMGRVDATAGEILEDKDLGQRNAPPCR